MITDVGAVLPPRVAARLPARLADVLVGLGTAANELAIAEADARVRERQTQVALARVSERESDGFLPPEYYMICEWVTCAQDHAERLIAIYAHIAAAYATHTLDAFTHLAHGDEPPNGDQSRSCRRTS